MKRTVSLLILLLILTVCACGEATTAPVSSSEVVSDGYISSVNEVPEFSDSPYVAIKDNIPDFKDSEKVTDSFEKYSSLDDLGRCGVAYACIGQDIMPTEDREGIGQIKPSGWQTVKYDIVDGKYLYNRCHLIGFQLTGENANEKNLITGTRYMNVEGMLPFENMIADYVKETDNHVLYRVTPVYDGTNLVARGVQLEALSVEDGGDGICFNVYVYNNQPGITIDYANGNSTLEGETEVENSSAESIIQEDLILNTNSKKIHKPDCSGAARTKAENKESYNGDIDTLLSIGYTKCKICFE